MSSFPYIFTFYSYKGGVGRSMALLNTAYALVGRGRHVLIVDFDLEAPGVSGFLLRNGELDQAADSEVGDAVDLISAAHKAGRLVDVPPIERYVRSVPPAKLEVLTPKLGKLGRLDVVVAGQADDYWQRLAGLRLNELLQEELLELSAKLWSYFKAQRFPFQPLGLEDEPAQDTPYDYILVDSRTGMTETGGLCVGPLADRLVVVTGLNDQNVTGTLEFLKEAGITPEKRKPGEEGWDEADPVASKQPDATEGVLGLGPKPTLVVASPLPPGELTLKQERLQKIAAELGEVAVTLSYHPQMALMETNFVRDHRSESLAREYHLLTSKVMSQVGDHPLQLTADPGDAVDADVIGRTLRLAAVEPDMGDFLLKHQSDKFDAADDDGFLLLRRLNATLALRTGNENMALNKWGIALAGQAKTKTGEEADRLFDLAYEKYGRALEVEPDMHEALNNWGTTLGQQAKRKTGEESDRLFALAFEKYARALEIKPDKHGTLYNWGKDLAGQAERKIGAEADRLFAQAHEKYARALELDPDLHEALYNWGTALCVQAESKPVEEADRLFALAYEKYARALEVKPDLYEALNNWGASLGDQARTKTGEDADRLFVLAYEKYGHALEVKPDMHEALNNWAEALEAQAKMKTGEEGDRLLALAADKRAQAAALQPTTPDDFAAG